MNDLSTMGLVKRFRRIHKVSLMSRSLDLAWFRNIITSYCRTLVSEVRYRAITSAYGRDITVNMRCFLSRCVVCRLFLDLRYS